MPKKTKRKGGITEKEELTFYRSLAVSRKTGITKIDGGETATNLHEMWEALQFYADRNSYTEPAPPYYVSTEINKDYGRRARIALKMETAEE